MKITSYFYKTKTNGGHFCKIYVEQQELENQQPTVVITKLHLTKEDLPPEFRLVKTFKDVKLYQEFIIFRLDTLVTIAAHLVKPRLR